MVLFFYYYFRSHLTRWVDRNIPFDLKIEHMPGAKKRTGRLFITAPGGEASRVSLFDNKFTVAKLRSINNFLCYQVQKTTGVAFSKSSKPVVSANENKIGPSNRKLPPDEGGKSRDRLTTNQNAAMRIIECNDREGAKLVKSITNCQLREFAFHHFCNLQNNNYQMANLI